MEIGNDSILKAVAFKDFDAFYAVNYYSLILFASKETYDNIVRTVNHVLDTTTDSSIREKYLYFERNFREKINRKSRK